MMMMALTKLSNCAASTSRMMTSAKPKMVTMPLLVSPSVAASASGMMRLPGGSSGVAISCGTASASPRAKSRRRLGGDGDRGLLLLAGQRWRQRRARVSVAMVDIGTIAAVRRLQEDVLEVGRIVDRVGGRDQLHGIAAVADIDVADLVAVEHRLLRVGQPGDVDAEIGGALAIDARRQAAAA